MLGLGRDRFGCRMGWLPVVLVAMIWVLAGVAQASTGTGTVRIEVLHDGRNISAGCFGTLIGQTGRLIALLPQGDALVAQVPAGTYTASIHSVEDDSLPPQLVTVTVVAGETVSETVVIGGPMGLSPELGPPGAGGGEDGKAGGTGGVQPGAPGTPDSGRDGTPGGYVPSEWELRTDFPGETRAIAGQFEFTYTITYIGSTPW